MKIREIIVKKFLFFIILITSISCLKNPVEIEPLKYSKNDLIPLNDSIKSLYYNDAAYIEFRQIIQDTMKRYEQVKLQESNINLYYQDLLNIYNKSFAISNSFFENFSSIHTFDAYTLYRVIAAVDTNKVWVEEWLNGNNITGITGIDSLLKNYDTEVIFNTEFFGYYHFTLKTKAPLNYLALQRKLEKTGEFHYVEPDVIIGGGSYIAFVGDGNKIYQYTLGWGDCPSGCIYYHYWKIKVTDKEITLLEEGGDPTR